VTGVHYIARQIAFGGADGARQVSLVSRSQCPGSRPGVSRSSASPPAGTGSSIQRREPG